jgi:hypothetical protein
LFDCLAVLMRNRNMGDTPTATKNCPVSGVAHHGMPAAWFARSTQRNSATWQAADGNASFRATRTKVLAVSIAGYALSPIVGHLDDLTF